ncbi:MULTISPECIES: MerR family transcriptional regulator [Enterobacter cloacae complex]|jgi:Predicted transcriptional regulators|uniref:MerR family transcriptional regulator n=1 Tax=Enterobacter cloacae complex TaxID=354276 RepID=UPI0004506857|nr:MULTISPECIES: MerR family transcriptional regulator [Enterobacter cloacae complex]OOK62476.1 MerR family transcriptional regulator [Pedobacter himalayensis]TZG20847.1 MerR family transcriptional regulator [Enterobacter sp. RVSM5a]ELC6547095.1 MerR family transcriptional regulator [Enterobacter hormaechei]ELC7201231.1 MerR family transcriptional regulator [Enterobacter hormaechei]EUL94754.1 MerR family transcriptional regulator [Enterobacter hormaechei]
MLIQVGELAKRAGITVRTLHHYEQTELLLPSARSAAGYRLYNLADVQRLHMIQALAKAGLELAEIRDFLEQRSLSLAELLDGQITLLDKQLRSIHTLRNRLVELRTGLTDDATPDLESWLQTLELMNMYDRWFSKEELQQLPFAVEKEALADIWAGLVTEVKHLLEQNVSVTDARATDLASRWMERLEQDTAGKPEFLTRLNEMHSVEPQMQEQTGITPEITDYITRAFAESKLSIWEKYLTAEEMAFTRAHYFDRMMEWPPLVAKLHQAQRDNLSPASDDAQKLAEYWLVLFQSYAGTNPQTQQKFRLAMQQEPHLMKGTWMTPAVLEWLQQAIGVMMQRRVSASDDSQIR